MRGSSWVWFHLLLGSIHLGLGIWVFTEPTLLDGIEKSSNQIGGFKPYRRRTDDEQSFEILREFEPWFSMSPIAIHAFVAILTGVSHYWSAWIRWPIGVKISKVIYFNRQKKIKVLIHLTNFLNRQA